MLAIHWFMKPCFNFCQKIESETIFLVFGWFGLLYVVVAVLSFDVGGGKICNKLLQKERKSLTITIQFKLANKRVQEDVSDLRI